MEYFLFNIFHTFDAPAESLLNKILPLIKMVSYVIAAISALVSVCMCTYHGLRIKTSAGDATQTKKHWSAIKTILIVDVVVVLVPLILPSLLQAIQ